MRHHEPRRGYRHKSVFASIDDCRSPLDRNARARLLHAAESLEARTRQRGRQNGAISRIGLLVLRTLMLKFLSRRGSCFPSYDAISRATGLCRESVARAISRLEQSGFLRVVRRVARREIWQPERARWIVAVVQTSNCYCFDRGIAGAEHCAPPATGRGPFPERRQRTLWERTIDGLVDPSLRRRREKQPPFNPCTANTQSTGSTQG